MIRARHDRRVSRRALITRRRISRRTRRARRVRQRRVVRRRRIHRATHHPRPRLPRRKRLPTHDHATREGAAVRRKVRIVALHPADLLTHTRTSQHLRAQHITHTHTRRIRRAIVRHRQRVLHAIPSHHTATHNRRTQRHNRVRHMQIRSSVGDGNRETVPTHLRLSAGSRRNSGSVTADPAPLATLTSKVYVVSEAPLATAPRGQWMFCVSC